MENIFKDLLPIHLNIYKHKEKFKNKEFSNKSIIFYPFYILNKKIPVHNLRKVNQPR